MHYTSLLVVLAVGGTSAIHHPMVFPKMQSTVQFPDLEGLVRVLEKTLEPHQRKYLDDIARAEGRPVKKLNLLKLPETSAASVWHDFERAMESALDDPKLRLDAELGPVRNDASVFVAISSFRDRLCSATLRSMFRSADRPELVNVGVVQQNCESEHACKTGVYPKFVARSGADPDCAADFCQSSEGRLHCQAGRVRILRLGEHMALGPFFARYLNSKMWRGENYFMQIDAHTRFRKGWDTTMVQMMKRTPSYPNSVISTYPAADNAKGAGYDTHEGLCHATFEQTGGDRYTVRMQATVIPESTKGVPRYAAFIAAGFFFTHGSSVERVPWDPFLPYIFMGEEIALSEKFWTAGFDIYAPTTGVVSHYYGRMDAPKFWDSVNMVFSNGGMYGNLANLIVQRVQNLIGFPEARRMEQLSDATVLARMPRFSVERVRSRAAFLEMTGLDLVNRTVKAPPRWCTRGEAPPHALVAAVHKF